LSESLQVLIDELHRRSAEEIKKIKSEAEAEAQKIIEDAKERAERLFLEKVSAELPTLRNKILGSVEGEARTKILLEKDRIVKRAFELAKETLIAIAEGKSGEYKYDEILYQLIKEAAVKLGEKELYIIANEKDKKLLSSNITSFQKRLSEELGDVYTIEIEPETINVIGGVIIRNKDRTKIYNNTFDGRLRTTEDRLRGILGKILFK